MKILKGQSHQTDTKLAFEEATKEWSQAAFQPDLILIYHSTEQDSAILADLLNEKYPNSQNMGCTTAGEILDGKSTTKSLTMMGIQSNKTKWVVDVIEGVADVSETEIFEKIGSMSDRLGVKREELNENENFALILADPMSGKSEEFIYPVISEALNGIGMIGGSAGDDLKFAGTASIINGKSYHQSYALALAKCEDKFKILKHQHFKSSPVTMVVTEAEPATRKIITLDGLPAADRYSQLTGTKKEEMDLNFFAMNPFMFPYNNQLFIRSPHCINDDGSISFYCAVEQGLVVALGAHNDMESELKRSIDEIQKEFKSLELLLGFNCVFRALESNARQNHDQLGSVYAGSVKNMIAFETYGECFNGFNMNQTLTGIVFGE